VGDGVDGVGSEDGGGGGRAAKYTVPYGRVGCSGAADPGEDLPGEARGRGGASQAGSSGARRVAGPTHSRQMRVGRIFAGLARPRGSQARRRSHMRDISSSVKLMSMY